MKSRRMFLGLLRFNLQLLPRTIWLLLPIVVLSLSTELILAFLFRNNPRQGDMSGIGDSLNAFPLMFCVMLGIQFFIAGSGYDGKSTIGLMPAGEFLFVRPVPRRLAYLSRVFLYFSIILSAPLLKATITMAAPDLHLSLYHRKAQSTEAADKLKLYQAEFPNSSIVGTPGAGYNTLVIPYGGVLIALWELWLVILFALALEMAAILAFPPKVQFGLLIALCLGPFIFSTLSPFGDQTPMLEDAFFAFAHHLCLITILTLGVFILVQRFALKRIENWEVI